jgi:hypothetical protein
MVTTEAAPSGEACVNGVAKVTPSPRNGSLVKLSDPSSFSYKRTSQKKKLCPRRGTIRQK